MNSPKRKEQIRRQNANAYNNRPKKPLTEVEKLIINLLYQEHTSKEIGIMVGLSPRTVENHRLMIIKKIGCRNLAGIVKYAIKKKLVIK